MRPNEGNPEEPVVSIIVVSFNTREMTLECLRSIQRETPDTAFEVLFIDNRSSDGSFEAVSAEFDDDPRFVLESSEENLGFAGANNHMARLARGRFVLLLNPDTVVLDRAVEKLVEFAERFPGNGIWGGRTIFEDGSLNPTSSWGWYGIWTQICYTFGLSFLFPGIRFFNLRAYPGWDRTGIREVGVVTGCFFLITRDLWNRLEGFDPEFFMYGEEADLCQRSRKFGAKPIVSGEPTIVHHTGASETNQVGKMTKLLDGEVRLLRRHASGFGFAMHVLLIKLRILIRATADLAARATAGAARLAWAARRRLAAECA